MMMTLLLSNINLIVEILLGCWGVIITLKWRKLSVQCKEQLSQLQILSSKRLSPFTKRQINQALRLDVNKLVHQLEKLDVSPKKKRATVLASVVLKDPTIGSEVVDEAIRLARGK